MTVTGGPAHPGSGPGVITRDGCAVEFYALLATSGEPEIVHAALPPGASILELGAGTGRLTHPLLALGHPVLAVDFSAAMLARIGGARTLLGSIEDLRLAERFDAVLLASRFANTPDRASRRAMLRTCRAHLAEGGRVLLQWFPPAWFDGLAPYERTRDGVTYRLHDLGRPEPDVVSATIEYRVGPDVWTQSFTARRFTAEALAGELAAEDLAFDGWLTEDHAWFAAVARA